MNKALFFDTLNPTRYAANEQLFHLNFGAALADPK